MAVFIAVIVLVCYFFIPRKPTFCVSVGYPNDFSASSSGFNVSIPLNVSVDNPNYYGFSLGQTTVNVVYKIPGQSDDTLLSSITAPDIHIKARGNSTNGFNVTVQNGVDNTAADASILKDCTPSGTTTLYINAAVTLLKRIHISVPDQAVPINCSTLSVVGAAVFAPTQVAKLANSSSQGQVYCKKADW